MWNKRTDLSEKVNNRGVTTIVVVCAMAIIMALSLSLFLTASVMMQESGKSATKEQSRILAVSFSKQLQQQLTGGETVFENREGEIADKVQSGYNTSLWHYIKQNISDGSWPYYEEQGTWLHNRENAIRSFTMDNSGIASEIATTEISLYWTKKEEGIPESLIVETSVTVKGQSCTITDIYELEVTGESYETWKWKHAERK